LSQVADGFHAALFFKISGSNPMNGKHSQIFVVLGLCVDPRSGFECNIDLPMPRRPHNFDPSNRTAFFDHNQVIDSP
jgi:hypothetical protein